MSTEAAAPTLSIRDRVIATIKQDYVSDAFKDEITSDTNLSDDLALDSLDLLELVMFLEESFDIEIPDEAIAGHVYTVGDLIRVVERIVAAK